MAAKKKNTRELRQKKTGRRAAGLVRVDVWLPDDIAGDLEILCLFESISSGLAPGRCRTIAVSNAIRAQAKLVRGKTLEDLTREHIREDIPEEPLPEDIPQEEPPKEEPPEDNPPKEEPPTE